ncbi:MAG TPA: type I glyceraldehyde-3-phosphate dehydrogenase [Candidatus Saccharimonadales bacterium]|nr:type I glyceraldehyde-3-phosphate dehydrogenase [Candidatus Saccharimonadales bacterium]
MRTRVAINGFGRIGRNAFKIAFERDDLEVVAINDLTDTKTLAHLLKFDSNYGIYQHDVSSGEGEIVVDNHHVLVLSEKDPAALPWGAHQIDVVIESTGLFTDPKKAHAHIHPAGAKRVVISAPAHGAGASTIVLGVNEEALKEHPKIIDNASCTTNSLAPVAEIVEEKFGIEKALMSTIHSYTQDQRLQDAPHKDLRRARAAAENIVPTTTGAAIAAALTVPALQGKFNGLSFRVPTPVVSLSDITFLVKKEVTEDQVNDVFRAAAKEPRYQGILDVNELPLVSKDFHGNSHSAIVDLPLTMVVGGNLLKVVAWYDNEWGYSNRLVEMTADAGRGLS